MLKLTQENNEEKEEDCGLLLGMQMHIDSNSPPAEQARFVPKSPTTHHPLLPLPPLCVQELNYSDNLA